MNKMKPPKILKNLTDILPSKEPKLKKCNGKIIPVCEPNLKGNELKYVTDCIKTNWISSIGSYVEKFEKAFSSYCGTKYGVACSSGTTALHLALASLDIKEGDEVIIPTFTMVSVANAVLQTGAKPVLVDSDPYTWNLDTKKIKEKITKNTKAIIPVHTYGHPAEMDEIMKLARQYKLYVIEDAAEAHGSLYKGRFVGSIGDVGCFSFYGNKIITTGEGGMVVTNNKKIYEMAICLRDLAFSKERHFWHKYIGFNYRMTNLQAAIGLAQVERFNELIKMRIRNVKLYDSLLKNIEGITLPPRAKSIRNVFWMYAILLNEKFGITRDELRMFLAKSGIETRIFFIPIHLQPIYFKMYKREYPVAENLCKNGLYLPSSPNLTEKQIKYIVEKIYIGRKI